MLEHVVAIHKVTLAETHLDRLASQHALASAYRAKGRVKKTVAIEKETVAKTQINKHRLRW